MDSKEISMRKVVGTAVLTGKLHPDDPWYTSIWLMVLAWAPFIYTLSYWVNSSTS